MLSTLMLLLATGTPVLQNPGFEASQTLQGWTSYIHEKTGRDPVIRIDGGSFKEGKQSLVIEVNDPADVSVSQRIFLPVGSLWRVKGWIKTEKLASKGDTDVFGLIDVQTPAGSLAKTPTRLGTSPWGEAEATFRVAPPGELNISLFLIGSGKGTGRVWFDDIRLETVTESSATQPEEVRITSQRISRLPIDAKQGGQFIEPLCNLIPSMIAQQVNSTSFEEEPPCKFVYKSEIDKPYRPWYPDGAVHLAQFSFDTNNPFNGKRSQKIELPATYSWAGISQDGFYLKKGLSYRCQMHLRSEGNVPVRAVLHGSGGLLANPVSLGRAPQDWKSVAGEFRANTDTDNATLTIEFEGAGTLWLDRIYLIGEDAVLGIWRPDVAGALKEMSPGIIRFGGSAIEAYEWDQSIGSWDTRVPFTTFWGDLEPNFVGEEEFVELCHYAGAEPLICIRWSGKKPEDAAAQVEYFNGGIETRWGKLRAENGHPEPYKVEYWQIGNEIGGPQYDATVRAFAEAMKKSDPSIKILSSFPSAETLKYGGGYLDYLSPHHYECADLLGKDREFDSLHNQVMRYGAAKEVRVAVTEWNTTAGQWGLGRGMLQTLGNALSCSRYHNLIQRHADLTEIAIRSNLVDSFGSGVIITGPGWYYLSPTYYAQVLYSRSAGSFPLRLERSTELPWQLQEPDLSATMSSDAKILRIYGVNSTAKALRLKFRLSDFSSSVTGGTVHIVKDRDGSLSSEVVNRRDDPNRVVSVSRAANIKGNDFEVRFQPLSLTLLELTLGN